MENWEVSKSGLDSAHNKTSARPAFILPGVKHSPRYAFANLAGRVYNSGIRSSADMRAGFRAYRGRFKNAENRGLDDEGFARKWLEENPDDTVIMRDGSTRTRDDYGL
jgi:hypothetical protein